MCYDTYLCGESCFLNFESFYLREEKMKYARIKFLREKSGRTQAEVAKEIGLYTTTYQRYERGENEIPLYIAMKIAKYYNVSTDYIAELIDRPDRLNQ